MSDVTIIDVSPRDGLQNDPRQVSTANKIELVKKLLDARLEKIEVTSFVHPKKVPQMSDASDVLNGLTAFPQLEATALIPNLKGYTRAREHQVKEVNWVTSATDTFNKKNIGMSIDENFNLFKSLLDEAKKDNIRTCFSIAVAFGCPYEGGVKPEQVLNLLEKAAKLGIDRIGIADTIGYATPYEVEHLMKEVLAYAKDIPVAIHLHDTRGLGLANAYAAYEAGVRIFETSVSGIGGCPFAPGAAGNLATEDLVYLFERMGVHTGLDFDKLIEAANFAAHLTTNEPLGRIRHVERKFL